MFLNVEDLVLSLLLAPALQVLFERRLLLLERVLALREVLGYLAAVVSDFRLERALAKLLCFFVCALSLHAALPLVIVVLKPAFDWDCVSTRSPRDLARSCVDLWLEKLFLFLCCFFTLLPLADHALDCQLGLAALARGEEVGVVGLAN